MTDPIDVLQSQDGKATRANLRWGGQKRPLWETFDELSYDLCLRWIGRFAPYESVAAQWALAGAVEFANGIVIPTRIFQLRVVYLELQRVLWGAHYFCDLFRLSGAVVLEARARQLLEDLLQAQELLSGSRVLPIEICLGGTETDISTGQARKILDLTHEVGSEIKVLLSWVREDLLFCGRLDNLLPLSHEKMGKLALTGPIAQACGRLEDLRISADSTPRKSHSSCPTYSALKCNLRVYWTERSTWLKFWATNDETVMKNEGDAKDRFLSVAFQITQSVEILKHVVSNFAQGHYRVACPIELQKPPPVSFALEAPSGRMECIINSAGKVRLLSHSMALRPVVNSWLSGIGLDDLELAVTSLGIDQGQGDLCWQDGFDTSNTL